jgi:hypothetical protein
MGQFLTAAQQRALANKCKALLWTVPSTLLLEDRYLLDVDFKEKSLEKRLHPPVKCGWLKCMLLGVQHVTRMGIIPMSFWRNHNLMLLLIRRAVSGSDAVVGGSAV